jgi:glycerol-3-phosphate acyltransferase PlsY
MHVWSNIVLVALSYLLGGFSPGYWLVRWRAGIDVRSIGSGGTGATNVGRVLGRGSYLIVLVVDLAKGALVGGAALFMHAPKEWAFAAALAVVAGHVWPVWLGFRGGKGVGPFLGAWLVLAPLALAPSLVLGLLLLAWLRCFPIAGLCSLILLPASAWWITGAKAPAAAACGTIFLLLWSHRVNLRNFAAARVRATAASASETPTNSP